jgi:nitronate monooxygenase
VREAGARVKGRTNRSFNFNFMCHTPLVPDATREVAWRAKLAPYYKELGINADDIPVGTRMHFDAAGCDAVVEVAPKVVSFHYGPPEAGLVKRIKDAGCVVISSATRVAEARFWRRAAPMPSSRKGSMPAAIAACSSLMTSPPRSARWHRCRRWWTP